MINLLDHGSMWLEHKDYTGYLFSPEGDCISLRRANPRIQGKTLNGRGYHQYRLMVGGKAMSKKCHRIIAQIYIHNNNDLPQVNHINGIKTDNRSENLEWCDNSYNQKHSYKIGTSKPKSRGKNGMSKLTEESVKIIRDSIGVFSQYCLAKKFGVSQAVICDVQRNKTWTDKNFSPVKQKSGRKPNNTGELKHGL